MPEQAQRRAPVAPAAETPPDRLPDRAPDQARDFEELRHLIVAPEQEGLAEIRDRIENPGRRAEDVSSVVAEAIQMRRDQGDDRALAEALAPTIQETLRDSVRRNPHVLADALFPVMGPAIRKSITETLRSMLESFNEALEHSLSWQGIRWRVESFRTGKSFAEIVLMHSLLYRVEQVFLIHRETGLVMNHIVAPSVATQDPSLVAGMLSAIQQFVRDSFESPREDALGSLTIGDLQVWIEDGPHAVIAAVIRGHAPAGYRVELQEALENIESEFAPAIAEFHGDDAPFRGTAAKLQNLLVTHYRQKKRDSRKPLMAIAAGALIFTIVVGWAGYVTYQAHRWAQFSRALASHPGIVVTSVEKSGGQWHVRGFRDPLADNPSSELAHAGLRSQDAAFELSPFYSLDDTILTRRADNLLAPPPGVQLSGHNGSLIAAGAAPSAWIARFAERAPLMAGVTSMDVSQLHNQDAAMLESTVLTFPLGKSDLDPGQQGSIARAEAATRALRGLADATGEKVSVTVVGHTDSTGIEGTNRLLSNQRAAAITALFVRAGIPAGTIDPHGVGTAEPLRAEDTEEGRHLNRSVTFRVHLTPAPAAP
ncbi:MAG: OmpA family protein [Candidatus Acidiferrales bacterium]